MILHLFFTNWCMIYQHMWQSKPHHWSHCPSFHKSQLIVLCLVPAWVCCYSSIMQSTYSIDLVLGCSPTCFTPLEPSNHYHCLLSGSSHHCHCQSLHYSKSKFSSETPDVTSHDLALPHHSPPTESPATPSSFPLFCLNDSLTTMSAPL